MHSVAEYKGSLCHTLENIMQLAFGKEMQRAVGYSVKLLFLKFLNTASGKSSRDKLYNLSSTQIKISVGIQLPCRKLVTDHEFECTDI